jgi:hypothetical protein
MRAGSAILVGSLVEELESFFSNYGGVLDLPPEAGHLR